MNYLESMNYGGQYPSPQMQNQYGGNIAAGAGVSVPAARRAADDAPGTAEMGEPMAPLRAGVVRSPVSKKERPRR